MNIRFLDDLEIELVGWIDRFSGELARIEYSNDKKLFRMSIRKNHNKRGLPKTIMHELEHYDITETLFLMNVKPLCDPTPYPEWVHSEPSCRYDPIYMAMLISSRMKDAKKESLL